MGVEREFVAINPDNAYPFTLSLSKWGVSRPRMVRQVHHERSISILLKRRVISPLLFLIPLFLALVPVTALAADPVEVQKIAQQLVCQCGCYSVLNNCVHGECMVRDQMLTVIQQKLGQGQAPEQIIQAFVVQYGEEVLAEPPKKGFNLVGWITPFAAILAGAAVIAIALKRWVKRGETTATVAVETDEEDKKYQEQLEKELASFKERGFR
ncbi:MAG: cytochrome c-type biogenesis protein CcmH [Chloroflexi bacterium]|nr:cytochrome c-type biogenesis protein CcmH [Chloroflexota bacterium]